ncbi:MAG TPA: hypothetical protein EYG54_08490, partial [Myxococcales bacterium]|nr:hypothetical protein [Myxococcales bacterium]
DLRMDYTAQGDVVHLASRMETMAEAGTVRLTENVARLVEGYFELRDLGPTAVPGVVEEVAVYELKGTGAFRTRLDLARARGLSHFVGRDDEAAVLEDALRDASEGRGRTVGIVGDPGVGKSRLCSEFVSLCRHRGLQVHEAHCVSHGRVLALGTILELLWGWFGLDRKEPSGNARAKISKRVKGAKRLEELLPTVFDFLGVPDPERPAPNIGPEGRHLQIKAFLGELLCHESEHEAVVLHLDDIHWIDPASDEFLRVIVEAASEARVLVLLNFRPEYPAEWMLGWEYQQISLAELEAEGADALLTDLLGAEVAGSALGDLLRDRASGNPFFLEEAVRSLLDSEHLEGAPGQYRLVVDLDEVEIPNTVQPLLASRIDRLREGEKEALQAAAVIGRTFQETLLQEASGIEAEELTTVLGNLERLGFLAETALYPEREYTFNHPLLHEVAARTQLEAQRQARHRAVARAIQVLHEGGDELAGFSPLIAHHCEQGGDLLDAVRWHMRATDWLNNTDRRSALRHWQRIRQLASDLPHSGEVVPLALQACWHALVEFNIWIPMSDAEATSWSEEGISLAEQAGDLRMQGLLYGAFSYVKRSAGALPDQLAKAEEAVRLSDASGDPAAQVWSRSVLMTAQADLHLMPAAAQTGQDAVEIADRHPESAREPVMLQGRIYVSVLSAGVLPGLGRLSESLERLERLVGMARASGHQGFLHSALLFLGTSRIYGGDTEGAREAHDECWPLARSMGVWLEQEHYFYGQICLLEGNARDAVTHLEKAAELMTAGNFRATEAAMLSTLALAYAQADDPARAQEVANQTIELATERRQFLDVGRAQRALALALLGQSGTAGAG